MHETGTHPIAGRPRIELIPAKSRLFILSSNVSWYFFPGFVGIENLYGFYDTPLVPAEIFFGEPFSMDGVVLLKRLPGIPADVAVSVEVSHSATRNSLPRAEKE